MHIRACISLSLSLCTGPELLYRHCASCTGWRRLIGSPKLQIIFHKRATKYRSLLRKMTHKDKGSYESSPPCTTFKLHHCKDMHLDDQKCRKFVLKSMVHVRHRLTWLYNINTHTHTHTHTHTTSKQTISRCLYTRSSQTHISYTCEFLSKK